MPPSKRPRDDDDRPRRRRSSSPVGLIIGLAAGAFALLVAVGGAIGYWFLAPNPPNKPNAVPNAPNLIGPSTNALRPIGIGDFDAIAKQTTLASLQSQYGPGEVVSDRDRTSRHDGASAAPDAHRYRTLDDHGRELGVAQWVCWKSGAAELYVATGKKGGLVAKLFYLRESRPTYLFESLP